MKNKITSSRIYHTADAAHEITIAVLAVGYGPTYRVLTYRCPKDQLDNPRAANVVIYGEHYDEASAIRAFIQLQGVATQEGFKDAPQLGQRATAIYRILRDLGDGRGSKDPFTTTEAMPIAAQQPIAAVPLLRESIDIVAMRRAFV